MGDTRKGFVRRLAISLVAAIALLVAGETILRLLAHFFRLGYQRYDVRLNMIRLVPGFHDVIDGKPLDINSLGFRGVEVENAKPPEVMRIISIGDSVTFGLPGERCHYPGVLQALFDARTGGPRVEVINAGVEGYNSQDAVKVFEGEIAALSPDILTIFIGWNDLIKQDPARPGISEAQARLAYALYDVYIIKFWRKLIYYDLRRALLTPVTKLDPEDERTFRDYVPLVYTEHLQRLIDEARKIGSDVVLLTWPSLLRADMTEQDVRALYFPYYTYNLSKFRLLYERYNEAIRAAGRANGVKVVELQDAIRGRESELFMDTAHLQCEGYEIIAKTLYDVLAPVVERRANREIARGRD